MAKPRVFVSSTYYDLKYIRASLELFIESLGFEPVLSEKGDIAYTSDRPLDESCYREVENADIFVLIVGGRYGSEASTGSKKSKDFFDRYESITKKEYGRAVDKEIPVYVLIERGVNAEFQTFIRNKALPGIQYAHVDSINVFLLIEEILAKPSNNPTQMFDKFEDIQSWLREQWSGLFRELLRRQAQQQQLAGLSDQVGQLKETNETLKTYLEAVMRGVNKKEKSRLIQREEKRLSESRQIEKLRRNHWVSYILEMDPDISINEIASALRKSVNFEDFTHRIDAETPKIPIGKNLLRILRDHNGARTDFNRARAVLNLPPLEPPEEWLEKDAFEIQGLRGEPTKASDAEETVSKAVSGRSKPRPRRKAVHGKSVESGNLAKRLVADTSHK